MTNPAQRKAKLLRDNAARRRRMTNKGYRTAVNTQRRQRRARPGVSETVNAARRQKYETDVLYRTARQAQHQAWVERVREMDPEAHEARRLRKNAAQRQRYATDVEYRRTVIERTGTALRQKRANPAYRQAESARVLASYHHQTPEEKRAQNNRHHQQRRAAKAQAPVIERVELDVLFKRDRGICQICHKRCLRNQASNDHIIPLSKGGAHTYQNCVLAHNSCNAKKGNRNATPQQQRLFG